MKTLFKSFILGITLLGQVFAQDVYIPGDTVTIDTENGLKSVYVGSTSEETEPESLSQSVYGNLRKSLKTSYDVDWREGGKVLDDSDASVDSAINLYTSITNLNRLWTALGLYTEPEKPVSSQEPLAGTAGVASTPKSSSPPYNNFIEPVAQYLGYTFRINKNRLINTGTDKFDGTLVFIGQGTTSENASAPPNSGGEGIKLEIPPENTGANAAISIDPTYDPFGGADRFTIMAWIRRGGESGLSDNSASRIVSDTPSSDGHTGFDLRFSKSEGYLQLHVNGSIVGADDGFNANIAPTDNNWYHITVFWDGRTNTTSTKRFGCYIGQYDTINKYVNFINKTGQGQQRPSGIVGRNGISLYVGNSGSANTYQGNLNGYIDDIMLFKNWTPWDSTSDSISITNTILKYWAELNDVTINPDDEYHTEQLGVMNPDTYIYPAEDLDKKLQDYTLGHYLSLEADSFGNRTVIAHGERDDNFRSGVYSTSIGNSITNPFNITSNSYIYIKRKDHRTTGKYNDGIIISIQYKGPYDNNIVTVPDSDTAGPFSVGDSLAIYKNNPANVSSESGLSPSRDGYDGTVIEVDENKNLKKFVIGTRSMAVSGNYGIAMGNSCIAMGDYSIALGGYSGAFGLYAVAEGDNCFAYNTNATAKGRFSTADGPYTRAEGDHCYAAETNSYASGAYTKALKQYSQAAGRYATATSDYSFVWNSANTEYFSHGNGTFSINPAGGLDGFYIGNSKLGEYIDARIKAAFDNAAQNGGNLGDPIPANRINNPGTW